MAVAVTAAFMAVIIGTAALITIVIVCYKKHVEKTALPFPLVIQEAAVSAVPESADFEKILVAGIKDTVQAMKGYERIQSGYDSLPNYIVCYRGDELYIMTAMYSNRKKIEVDTNKILHFKKEQIQEIKAGKSRVLIFFKESRRFFAMGVSPVLVAPQTEAYENFMEYIKKLASEVKECI
ncbi:hypothetical protein [Hungatella effluvii]|uniref:hypothetical protein n=1 Tax=Hungatella effluvii TaxID=1096246 RepID=UPI002A7FE09F|nr:hypothetical protein [Hungatella effluvii]